MAQFLFWRRRSTTNATLRIPSGVVVDANGNLFVQSKQPHHKVNTNGIIITVAGGGSSLPGDGGSATNAVVHNPSGIVVDTIGNILSQKRSDSLSQVDTNIITIVAGKNAIIHFSGDEGFATNATLYYPLGITVDAIGNLQTSIITVSAKSMPTASS